MRVRTRRQWIQLLKRRAELAPVDPESDQELTNLAKADVPLAAFDRADESAIQVRLVGEPLLRVSGRPAICPDDLGQWLQLFVSFHGVSIST
jgi:hypothetical protein